MPVRSRLEPLVVNLSPASGERLIDLYEGVLANERLDRLGVSVLSVEPATTPIEVEEIKTYDATVRGVNLPGIEPEDVKFDPPTVSVQMPRHVRLGLPDELVVEAIVDPDKVGRAAPGSALTEPAIVRLRTDTAFDASEITFRPERVNVTFTVGSLVSETKLATVRVHIAGPHEDFKEYEIDLPTRRASRRHRACQ